MTKILIAGYYGFGNIGDEAILESVINKLSTKLDNIEIEVLSAKPNKTLDKYDIPCIDRRSFPQVLKAIKKCDLLVIGGGSLLQDITSKKSIYYYLAIIYMGLAFNKKIMMYSQGIGPIHRRMNRSLTSQLLNRVDFITVRDNNSKKQLVNMGVTDSKIAVAADPVIGLMKTGKDVGLDILRKHQKNFDENKPTIGIAFRYWNNNEEKINKILVNATNRLFDLLEANIVFIPFHHSEDIKVLRAIEPRIQGKGILIKEKYGVQEMLSIMENMDLLVGVRLHSLIFSAVAQIPMIAISYDPKVEYFMKSLGLKAFSRIEDLEEEALVAEVMKVWQNREELSQNINSNVEKVRERLKINEETIERIIDNYSDVR